MGFTCEDKRGGLFAANESSSWDNIGYYELGFDLNLGISGVADYGFDSIALNQDLSVPSQIIAVQNSTEFWTGNLGLGIDKSNFTDANQPSFLSSLVENVSAVPSHSYGYTAGAYYQLKGVPASLTFGGVDTLRFVPNDASFTLGSNHEPVVAINKITVSSMPETEDTPAPNWQRNPLTLLSAAESALFTIDSSTPFLWLPERVCDRFATALNLTYSEDLQLYLFANSTSSSDTSPATDQVNALTSLNITFTFTVSDLPDTTGSQHSNNTIDLVLPFAAFSLDLTYPFPLLPNATSSSPSVSYFPLRRAANESQFTIGRAFLQETYLAVDYERNNFSLSQAVFTLSEPSTMNLVPVTRPPNSIFPGPPSMNSSGLSTGAKAGIGAGVAVVVIIAALILAILLIRRRNSRKFVSGKETASTTEFDRPPSFLRRLLGSPSTSSRASRPSTHVSELQASERHPTELTGDRHHPVEIPSDRNNQRYEMPSANAIPVEMPGESVPLTYYQNGSSNASELPDREPARRKSTDKAALADEINGIRTTNLGNLNNTPTNPEHQPPPRYRDNNPLVSPMTPANARSRFATFRPADRNSSSDGVSPDSPAFNLRHQDSERNTNTNSNSSNPISSESGRHSVGVSLGGRGPSPTTNHTFLSSNSNDNSNRSSGVAAAAARQGDRLSPSPAPSHSLRRDGSLRIGQLQRDGSRNSSRFREEGISGIRDVNEDLYGQYPLQGRRYSWEEE
ncbi:MAG: hypothetical protein Q9227_002233 [Pyrenula ochraceoflavens]